MHLVNAIYQICYYFSIIHIEEEAEAEEEVELVPTSKLYFNNKSTFL